MTEKQQELWAAVLKEVDELRKGPHRGVSRSSAYLGSDGESVSALLDLGQDDGTHKVHFVTAHYYNGRLSVQVKNYFHNSEDYWEKRIEADEQFPHQAVVVDNIHYVVGSEAQPVGASRGHGGRKFRIRFFDGRLVTTTNLWHQGPIPPVFRDRLPNNAEFIDDHGAVVQY